MEWRGGDHMIISVDAEKAFEKIQCFFHDKNIQQMKNRKKKNFLNFIKGICEKSTVDIIFNA